MQRAPWILVGLVSFGVFASLVVRGGPEDPARPRGRRAPARVAPTESPEIPPTDAADPGLSLRAARLQAVFAPNGVELRLPETRPSWGWAEVDGLPPSPGPFLTTEGADIVRVAGPVRERWERRENGLEHSITIGEDPNPKRDASDRSGEVTIRMSVDRSLHLRAGDDAVLLSDAAGKDLLVYRELRVRDASGRPLPAQFEIVEGMIAIKVRYLEAAYPIVIDPLLGPAPSGPNGQAPQDPPNILYRWRASNVGATAAMLQYRAFYTDAWTWKRVYVDVDRNSATGYRYQGLGADFLIENDRLYAYSGSGTNWSWSLLGPTSLHRTQASLSGQTFVQWDLNQSEFGSTSDVNLLFEVEKPGAISTGVVYRHLYTPVAQYPTDQYAENDPVKVYYHVRVGAPSLYNHVLIDSDNFSGTGYPYGEIGADFLIENGTLYRYSGTGGGWGWTAIGSAPLVTASSPLGGMTLDWSIDRTAIGQTDAFGDHTNILFEGNDAGGFVQYQTGLYPHVFSPGTNASGWSLRNSGTTLDLNALTFVNGTTGWIVGAQVGSPGTELEFAL